MTRRRGLPTASDFTPPLLRSPAITTSPTTALLVLIAVSLLTVAAATTVGAVAPAGAVGSGETNRHRFDPDGSVALVRSAGGVGSSWVADQDTMVTNWHVARGGTGDIYVDFADGTREECYTVAGDPDMDLGILRCRTGAREPFELDTAVPEAGTHVTVTGYPKGVGPTTTDGEITSQRREVRGIETIQFTAGIQPGSSGSPVFDDDLHVRGVATFSGGLGVPSSHLEPLLATASKYPATKAGAEWRLRVRRSLAVGVVMLPIGFIVARRSGRQSAAASTARWAIGGVVVALAATQLQFALAGPAHLI